MPSEKDLQNNEIGPLIRKFLQGRDGVEVVDRMRILRLIENMTIGRNAVGYLTESLHGAGSPQAQRIQIARGHEDRGKQGPRAGAGRYRSSRPLQVGASKFRELCKSLPPSKQSYLDCFDVTEHGLCGAIRIPVFQRRDHIGVLLAVMQSAVF